MAIIGFELARPERIFDEIMRERVRQEYLKREGHFPFTCADTPGLPLTIKFAVLMEEVGEVARAVMTHEGFVTDGGDLKKELIQVAAVCVAWLESLE